VPVPAEDDGEAAVPAAEVVVVVELVELVVDSRDALGEPPVGTVSGGAAALSADGVLLPQAATPAASATPAVRLASTRDQLINALPSGTERLHPPAAVRAVI
jgi:hypothetical protein